MVISVVKKRQFRELLLWLKRGSFGRLLPWLKWAVFGGY